MGLERTEYNDWQPMISFAWEESARDEIVERGLEIIRQTDILVVIGYSFPYFNRSIDKTLFGFNHHTNRRVGKIFLQDPEATDVMANMAQFVADSFQTNVFFKPISNLSQFYMPYELD